jgi:hypothetical protein
MRCGMSLASGMDLHHVGIQSRRYLVTRTIGAAIGALLMMMFMAHIATRLTTPVSAAPAAPSQAVVPQR